MFDKLAGPFENAQYVSQLLDVMKAKQECIKIEHWVLVERECKIGIKIVVSFNSEANTVEANAIETASVGISISIASYIKIGS